MWKYLFGLVRSSSREKKPSRGVSLEMFSMLTVKTLILCPISELNRWQVVLSVMSNRGLTITRVTWRRPDLLAADSTAQA